MILSRKMSENPRLGPFWAHYAQFWAETKDKKEAKNPGIKTPGAARVIDQLKYISPDIEKEYTFGFLMLLSSSTSTRPTNRQHSHG